MLLREAIFPAPPDDRATVSYWRFLNGSSRTSSHLKSSLHALCDHLWLEYDASPALPGNESGRTVPSIFLSLRRISAARATHRDAVDALTALGWQRTAVATGALRTCFERLPPTARVQYVGLMLGRPDAPIRVCVGGMPLDATVPYLAATTGTSCRELLPVARAAAASHGPDRIPRVGMIHVDIDTRQGVLQRVGMERTFVKPCQRHGVLASPDRQFLTSLVSSRLCCTSEHNALLRWPGRSVTILPHELWWSILNRRINHVKFVADPRKGLQTKAYLFTSVRPHTHSPTSTDPTTWFAPSSEGTSMESETRHDAGTPDEELSDADLDTVVGGLTTPTAPAPAHGAAWRAPSGEAPDDNMGAELNH